MDQKTRKIITIYGGLHPRSNVERLHQEGSGVVNIEDCVNGGRQNLALYALRSNEVIITAMAELKLKMVLKQTREKKTTSDQMERESSSRSVLERNRKH